MLHLEDGEQRALIEWATVTPIKSIDVVPHASIADYLFASPNGGKRNPIEAARMNGLGVKKGISDLMLPLSRLGYHGLWIEMKKAIETFRSPSAARDAISDAQDMWILKMRHAGYAAAACFGWDEARRLICGYLGERSDFHVQYHQLRMRFKKTVSA